MVAYMLLELPYAAVTLVTANSSFRADFGISRPLLNLIEVIPLQLFVSLIRGCQTRRGNIVILLLVLSIILRGGLGLGYVVL